MVKINGTPSDAAGKVLLEYLKEMGYDMGRIAVEQNGRIVSRSQYGGTVLEDGDVIEIVSFVGGG